MVSQQVTHGTDPKELNQCYKCGHGPLMWDVSVRDDPQAFCSECDAHQPYERVMQALKSRTQSTAPSLTTPVVRPVVTAKPAAPQSGQWISLLRQELTDTLAKIAAVDVLRREAEQMVNALIAYGDTNVPALPWKRTAVALPQKVYRRKCVQCQHEKSHRNGRKTNDGESWMCYPCIAQQEKRRGKEAA